MGFLKSLSKSIKKSAPQSSVNDIGDVSEFGEIDTKPSGQEHAGIKRPSGQGDIARRGRRRSSEKQVVLGHSLTTADTTTSVNTNSFLHPKDYRDLTFIRHV